MDRSQGKPLTEGQIVFEPDNSGREAHGSIQPDGTFELSTFAKGDGAQGHRIKIGGLGRMANSAFGGKLNLCGTCSHLFTMFMVYLVVDNKYNIYVR